jgi:hypothetical protein
MKTVTTVKLTEEGAHDYSTWSSRQGAKLRIAKRLLTAKLRSAPKPQSKSKQKFHHEGCEEYKSGEPRSAFGQLLDSVIPAWSAGIQTDMDASGRILRTWMPAIHAGMTKLYVFMFCGLV